MTVSEASFDGLVGPTHNYAGLAHGNLASTLSGGRPSSPRLAALEGLAKMRALADLGLRQGVLPPHERPDVHALRRLGFSGSDREVIERAARTDPRALAMASSASAMWVANAATVAPSSDTADGRVHFVPANLFDRPHRAIEAPQTTRSLRAVFRDPQRFVVHEPLAAGQAFADEGAANHTRLGPLGEPGTHLFVYGRPGIVSDEAALRARFPARQTLEASGAVARLLTLPGERVILARQSAVAIDRGVFHHDVIGVGHERLLMVHELAFADREGTLERLRQQVADLRIVEVSVKELSLEDAVRSYLFNSQILTEAGGPLLIAAREVEAIAPARAVIDRLLASGVIARVRYFDLRQSMDNGGGPACLRLRVPLTDEEQAAVAPACWIDQVSHGRLVTWVERHYRDRLVPSDLADPELLAESRGALDELTEILGLGSIYPFQRG